MRRTTVRALAAIATAAALAAPATALAHGDEEHLDSAAAVHRATDIPEVSISTQERRAARIARRLGHRVGDAPAASRAHLSAAAVNPGRSGRWSPVLAAPVVPVFEALLPNGKVLMWDSTSDVSADLTDDHSFTRAAVYDPIANTSKRVDVPGFNLFCAGYVQLADGNVFVAGGNANRKLDGIRQTHTFDWRTETWTRGPDMRDGRWYPTVAAQPDGEALIIGGGPEEAEIRTTSGAIQGLAGVRTPAAGRDYQFLQTAPDGRSLLFGPKPEMSLIDPFGAGSQQASGKRDDFVRGYGSYAMYAVGKTLVSGGGQLDVGLANKVPSPRAIRIDQNSGTPVARATGSMGVRRRQHNLTVLADGSVLATGGMSQNAGGGQVDLDHPTLAAERWTPGTGKWTTLAPAAVIRQYHSTALLLPDGRVLTGGGGICGRCDKLGYLRKDFEVYTPPYLFRADGQPAARPQVTGAPERIGYDGSFSFSSPQAGSLRKVALIRLGSPTHSIDQSQRYVPLSFTVSGDRVTASLPNNANEAPPGPYMLFVVDAAGVPSVAPTVMVARDAPDLLAPIDLARGATATGTPACAGSSPAGAIDGNLATGFCSYGAMRRLQVDFKASRTIDRVKVFHANAAGLGKALNTADYAVETTTNGSSWTRVAALTGQSEDANQLDFAPRKATQIRVLVTRGTQAQGAATTRIQEVQITGSAPDAPVRIWRGSGAQGRSQGFQPGRYERDRGNLGSLLAAGGGARSIDVAPGFTATLCREPRLTYCRTLGPGAYPALPEGYDGAVKSLRVTRRG